MTAITTEDVQQIMVARLGLEMEPGDIGVDDSLLVDLGLDSVDLLELAIGIEKGFGVKLTQEDTEAFRSVSSLVEFCTDRLARADAAPSAR